ncbi:uncharacterized protein [Battus philenor]|uniref:uncharacterized protein isoform X2 n=1 Tax=Battus philenor TaxID=42288 RepID=UPI0035CF6D4D
MDLNINGLDSMDITEPACYEKIEIALDEIYSEDDEFMELLISKLDSMVVTWEQPWYQSSNCLTRPFKINDENVEMFRTDHICKDESDHIKKNWKKFVKKFNVPDKLLSFARWKNTSKCKSPHTPQESVRRFVTAFLAQGLERNIYQVYKYIVSHFGSPVKGVYKEEEEKLMEICFHHKPKDAVTNLSLLLGRDPRGIYKRLQQMYEGKPEKKRVKWNLENATKFLNLLLQHSGYSLEELKYRKFEKSVWLSIEKEMDHQSAYLKKFWYSALHVQIFVKKQIKLNTVRKKVFKLLRVSPYKVWTDIQWKELLIFFPDGFTHMFLYKTCSSVFANNKNYLKQPMDELLEYFYQKIKMCRRNKRLRTLQYKDADRPNLLW